MKFWAKLRFKGEKNAEYLIRAFFKEFNPKSSIVIRGNDAKVEIIFNNQPPIELIEAISHCEIIEFNFGKVLEEYSKDENEEVIQKEDSEQAEEVVLKEEIFKQTEQVDVDEEILQQTECLKRKRGRPATKKEETTKVVNLETVNIPHLEEIAKKATSFEHFIKLVVKWIEIDKRQEFFQNLVIVATEVESICWKELTKVLEEKGVVYNQYDKIFISQKVSEKLKDYSVTMLPFLNVMVQYKDYFFGHEQSDENCTKQAAEETVNLVKEESSFEVGEVIPKNRVKMECMPEIPQFEEVLGNVDKTQPIEDRVRYVLTAMGLKEKSAQEQQEIFEIANTAVRVERMAFDIIFLKTNIPMEDTINARMTFSKFINDFVSEYDTNKKVKLLDFLKQLQEIVMYESEIESFKDFTD